VSDVAAIQLTLQALWREADLARAVVERMRLRGVRPSAPIHVEACITEVKAHVRIRACEQMLDEAREVQST
jgi:hypothetical protein